MADIADARVALERHFGYPSFRPGQGEIIEAVLAGRDALAVMPTGAGKSVCYQVPAAVLPGLSIVVSPLISLMGDQVRALKDAGIRGSYLNSSLTARQQEVVMARAMAGWYDLMYVAPERLADPRFIWFASRLRVPLVAVDEVLWEALIGNSDPQSENADNAYTFNAARVEAYRDKLLAQPVKDGRVWWNAPEQVWKEIGVIGEECGLDWCAGGYGQVWGKGWDNPHFELMKE